MLWQTILTILLVIGAIVYLWFTFRRSSSGKESPCEKYCSNCSSCPYAANCEGDPDKGYTPVRKNGDKKIVP